ncbi:MAG: sigma-70 family RNA polymerase sigma factor [Candidatus Nanopelagicales bacterium]
MDAPHRDRRELADAIVDELPALQRTARAIVRDHDRADDLVHDTVVRALERADSFRGESSLRHWLRRIMHNLAIDQARRPSELVVDEIEDRWRDDEYTVDAEAVVARAETQAEVLDALVRIPYAYRVAVVLHDMEGLTMREIADITGSELPAAKQRLRRGRMALVSALAGGHERRVALHGVPLRCWDARAQVSDYLDGELAQEDAAQVERHLETCPTCPPLYAALVGVTDLVAGMRDDDRVVDPALAARIRASTSTAG